MFNMLPRQTLGQLWITLSVSHSREGGNPDCNYHYYMKLKTVQTKKVPAVGPYSQAAIVGNLIYTSGQIGLDGKTGVIVGGIEKQTEQVLYNLTEVLKSAGSDLKHVLKTTIYLKNMADFQIVNEIYGSYFTEHKPARATIEVARLPKDVLIEIDAVAVTKE